MKELRAEEITMSGDFEVRHLGTDSTYKHTIVWSSVLVYMLLHACGVAGLVLCLCGRVMMPTMIWATFYLFICIEGVTMGTHRRFSHRAYKTKPLLECIILLMHVAAGQHSTYIWARDHRQHHRYCDTDGDPHNATRGLFYSHIGWLMTKRHPLCKVLRKTIDMSDLKQNKLVMLQYKYYQPLYFVFGFLIPGWVPVYFWGETLTNALLVSYALRYVLSLNSLFMVNSIAHKYGMRPYDKNMLPTESWFTSMVSFGEGWHNYHHAFPWDYKASELDLPFQTTTKLIEFSEFIGLAYDLKSVSPDMLHNRIKRCGDGTHQLEDLTGLATAIGPVHRCNPTYTGIYPDPDCSELFKIRTTSM